MSEEAGAYRLRRSIPSVIQAGHELIDEILSGLADMQWTERDVFAIRMALEEAVVNAIMHGNQLDAAKRVHVEWMISTQRVWIQITDEGAGFDPAAVPDCTDHDHIDLPCGRGLLLMRSFMNRVEYLGHGNVVMMEKDRSE